MPHANNKPATYKTYRLAIAVVAANLLSIGLLLGRVMTSDSSRYIFLLTNIFLAAIPVLLALWLVSRIRRHGWLKPKQLALTALWLVFLPNSFYLITDFVHFRPTFEADAFFDIVLLASFMVNGLILGFISVVLVHRELMKKLAPGQAFMAANIVLLSSAFAVYLGRFTRWNSWDIALQPAGLLFDVSERFINPGAYPQTFAFTVLLFVFLAVFYWVLWEALAISRRQQ